MKFGLIGHPIAHSLSPALFKAGYNGRYPYELIETADFEEAYQRFIDDYDGINVTAPFKEPAYAKADIISDECRLIGATNLLIKTPEGVTAYNSDYRGLLLWLQDLIQTKQPSEITVLIAGLGGAGKAAAVAAWKAGLKVTLMNRDISKSEYMADRLGTGVSVRPLTDFTECFNEADIIIYNLPVRLPEIDMLGTDNKGSRKHLLEANYKNPSFDRQTLDRLGNIEYHSGLTWLLLQALTGYELFTGEKPDLSQMTKQI
jgi:shikimate dehydrogenase